MNLEKLYRDELEALRTDSTLLFNYSIDSTIGNNRNQIKRNRILIALYNDCKPSDYDLVKFLFNEERKLRKADLIYEEYEVDVLYLAAYLLTKFDKVEDIWDFIDIKTTDFDSSIGFDIEYFFSFGIEKVKKYLINCDHPEKQKAIRLLAVNSPKAPFTQEEIDKWKLFKQDYFSVFKFPIIDRVYFAFQAKEYEQLKDFLPDWLAEKDTWSENQTLTSIAIGRKLKLNDFYLASLKHYVETFENSVRIEMYKKDIAELS